MSEVDDDAREILGAYTVNEMFAILRGWCEVERAAAELLWTQGFTKDARVKVASMHSDGKQWQVQAGVLGSVTAPENQFVGDGLKEALAKLVARIPEQKRAVLAALEADLARAKQAAEEAGAQGFDALLRRGVSS